MDDLSPVRGKPCLDGGGVYPAASVNPSFDGSGLALMDTARGHGARRVTVS